MAIIGPFRGQYYCFSTYFSSSFRFILPISGLDAIFPNLETALHAAKYQTPLEARRFVDLYGHDPRQAHRYGISITGTSEYLADFSNILYEANLAKFTSSRQLAGRLIATNGDYLINYNYWHDTTLGVCACHKCMHKGMNRLGITLMAVRNRILEVDNQVENIPMAAPVYDDEIRLQYARAASQHVPLPPDGGWAQLQPPDVIDMIDDEPDWHYNPEPDFSESPDVPF